MLALAYALQHRTQHVSRCYCYTRYALAATSPILSGYIGAHHNHFTLTVRPFRICVLRRHGRAEKRTFDSIGLTARFETTEADELQSGQWVMWLYMTPAVHRFASADTLRLLDIKQQRGLDPESDNFHRGGFDESSINDEVTLSTLYTMLATCGCGSTS
jgi:hypothetical protein